MIKKGKKEKGFTLIELLLVVAIIGLLSVISFNSITDSRDKAKNTRKNEIALQYFKALQLYVSGGGVLVPTTTYRCLGYTPSSEFCRDTFTGSLAVNNMFTEHYPEMPKDQNFSVPINSSVSATGIEYHCTDVSPGNCNLIWYLKGDETCAAGAIKYLDPLSGNYTRCTLDLSRY